MGFLLKLATGNPLVLLWAALGILAFGLATGGYAGWQLENWRMSAKIGPLTAEVSRLQARSTILEGSNAQCAESVKTQENALRVLEGAAASRARRAAEALRSAQVDAATLGTALTSLRALQAPLDGSCPAQAMAAARVIQDEIRGRK